MSFDDQIALQYFCYMSRIGYTYILTNKTHSVLYVGVTTNLARRVYEHKNGMIEGFTKRYHIKKLVYYAGFALISDAIAWEKKLKQKTRIKKIRVISEMNPEWKELEV